MNVQKEIFTKIYKENIWHGKESKSGRGSDSDQTNRLIIKLIDTIKELNITSLIDCPCGDMNWMKHVLSKTNIAYYGYDIVEELIQENTNKFSLSFKTCNAIDELITEKADAIFCRDMLNHLTISDIWKVLNNFLQTGSKYIILTNFVKDRQNIDLKINTMGWRALNFYKYPFHFPAPIKTFAEGCPEKGFEDKSITIWKLSDLKAIINAHMPKIPIPKKWELQKIPKICYFFWDSEMMPFLRYATIASFQKQNPDWQIKLYTPTKISNIKWKTIEHGYDVKGSNYFDDVAKLENVEIIDCDLNKLGFDGSTLNGVFQSDILRWHLLSEYGGLWSDMDIIYTRPMNDLSVNINKNANIDGTVCVSNLFDKRRYLHSIGFILSAPKNPLYKWVFEQTKNVQNMDNYQCFGADLLNIEFPNIQKIENRFNGINIVELGLDAVYTYGVGGIIRNLHTIGNTLTEYKTNTIGIHWYAGSPHAELSLNKYNKDNYTKYKSPICEALIKSGI